MLQQIPSPLPLYLRAAASARRKPKEKPIIPALEEGIAGLRVDAARLSAYNAVCGFEDAEILPITYPQVMAAAIHMHLMTQPQFPLPLLGLVHLRNHIEQSRALRVDEAFDVAVQTGETRDVRQGIEFDLVTQYGVGGETLWRAVTTILYRMPGPKSQGKPPAADTHLAEYRSFDVPVDIGRRYAKVSGDYNPIHMSAMSAKLFGFPRAIAHGMWSLARCAALLQPEVGTVPHTLDVSFRQPLLLPGKVALKFQKNANGVEFSLLSRSSDKVHLGGAIR